MTTPADLIHDASCRDNQHDGPEAQWPCNVLTAAVLASAINPDDEALVEKVAMTLFAHENCGKSDDARDRWETCLNNADRAEYVALARAALKAATQ